MPFQYLELIFFVAPSESESLVLMRQILETNIPRLTNRSQRASLPETLVNSTGRHMQEDVMWAQAFVLLKGQFAKAFPHKAEKTEVSLPLLHDARICHGVKMLSPQKNIFAKTSVSQEENFRCIIFSLQVPANKFPSVRRPCRN